MKRSRWSHEAMFAFDMGGARFISASAFTGEADFICRKANIVSKRKTSPLDWFFFWRRHPDLNWGIADLQSAALPLGYGAGYTGRSLYKNGAAYEARTRYLHLGKVALYRMS